MFCCFDRAVSLGYLLSLSQSRFLNVDFGLLTSPPSSSSERVAAIRPRMASIKVRFLWKFTRPDGLMRTCVVDH